MGKLLEALQLKRPLIVAPMAGGPSSPELVAAASNAGALGSMGAAYMAAAPITEFVRDVRAKTDGPFAINLFVPQADPQISSSQIALAIQKTAAYRRELNLPEPAVTPPYTENFAEQFAAVLRARPAVISYVFGVLPAEYIEAAKREKILLIGTATTLTEARAIEDSDADAVVLQGLEAGGHRGIFDPNASDPEIGLFDLLKACAGKIKIPRIAAGGLMTAEHIRQALQAGAEAVQLGTAFLTCKEAGTSAAYRERLLATPDRKTQTTRVFSGRLARGLQNKFMSEMEKQAEAILPYPAQNKFTRDLRSASAKAGSADFLSLWAGTGSGALWRESAGELIERLFT